MLFKRKLKKPLKTQSRLLKDEKGTIPKEDKKMGDLQNYIAKRKVRDSDFGKDYDKGYKDFKIGVMLKIAREESGLTQEQLAKKLKTKKSAISRIENHAEDIKLSTLDRFAQALGKTLLVEVA
jgi:ribosome-binding protein aMBF1 (putative translation factor)